MYRCVSKSCLDNLEYPIGANNNCILNGREREMNFRPRILLNCGHSICAHCINILVNTKKEEYFKCDDCCKTTNFSLQAIENIRARPLKGQEIVRWNEGDEEDFLYEAFSIGSAFNSGRISITSTPCVDIDEGQSELPNLSPQAYKDESQVLSVENKVNDSFRAVVTDAISMYRNCGKSLKSLFEAKAAVNKQFLATKEAIRKRFHVLHGLLQLEESEIIRKLVLNRKSSIKSINDKEKEIDEFRSKQLKTLILRSPQYQHTTVKNPIIEELTALRPTPYRINRVEEIPNLLPNLHKPHDDLHQAIKKLVDFNSAVHLPVRIQFGPLKPARQLGSNVPSTPEAPRTKTNYLSYIPCIRQHIVNIPSTKVKDSGYFEANLVVDENVARALKTALNKWCGPYRHTPTISKLAPGQDVILWHELKKEWVRGKIGEIKQGFEEMDKENCLLFDTHLTRSDRVSARLTDYDEVYETDIANVRESSAQLTDQTAYPTLIKVLKCRLNNIQNPPPHMKHYIFKFCPDTLKVRLLVLAESENGILDVDIAHDIRDLTNPQPTLIEYLIFSNIIKLKGDPNRRQPLFPYPTSGNILKYERVPSVNFEQNYSVDVTFIKDPHYFYTTMSRKRDEIDSMEVRLNAYYNDPHRSIAYRLYYPRVIVPCAARCELFYDKKMKRGKQFHRGLVTCQPVESGKTEVDFFAVDYGDDVKVLLNELRILPDSFLSLPPQALRCRLADLVQTDPSIGWSKNAISTFIEYFQTADSLATMIPKSYSDKRFHVILKSSALSSLHPEGNVNEILAEQGFATRKVEGSSDDPIVIGENVNNGLSGGIRNDYRCLEILKDMVRRTKKLNLGAVDSLVPVIVTSIESSLSFYVQINTPEYQKHIKDYFSQLEEDYARVDVNRTVFGMVQGFEPKDLCVFYHRPERSYSRVWRRGVVIKCVHQGTVTEAADPRMNRVAADSMYEVRDRDSGLKVVIERKFICHLPPSSKFRRDAEKCVQVFIPYIKTTDKNEEAIKFLQDQVKSHHKSLFLAVENLILTDTVEQVPADLIYQSMEIPDAFAPSEEHYYSIRFALLESGLVQIASNETIFEKELEIPDHSIYEKLRIPPSFSDRSLISSLRNSTQLEPEPKGLNRYLDSMKPTTQIFKATCTHIEDGLIIWFNVQSNVRGSPSMGTIRKSILRRLLSNDSLTPFVDSNSPGCTVYHNDFWYRGEIVKRDEGAKILVRHVDSGLLKFHFVDTMSSDIFCEEIPRLALRARLHKCVPFDSSNRTSNLLKEYLSTNLVGKKIKVKWENMGSSQDMEISVTLEDGQRDLKRLLLNKDMIQESSAESHPSYVQNAIELMGKSDFEFPSLPISLEKFYPVIIGDLVEENYLYLQMVSFNRTDSADEEDFNSAYLNFKADETRLNAHIGHYSSASDYSVGNTCCARWNGEWFRGIVSEVIDPQLRYKVFFVDWGNSDIIERSNMRILPDDLSGGEHPIFGFFVRLTNIRPARNGIWSKRLLNMMKAKVDESVRLDIVAKFKTDSSMPFEIELYIADADQNPTEHFFRDLIDDGYLELVE